MAWMSPVRTAVSGRPLEGAGLDGGVEGVGVAVEEELAEFGVGDFGGALGEELLDGL